MRFVHVHFGCLALQATDRTRQVYCADPAGHAMPCHACLCFAFWPLHLFLSFPFRRNNHLLLLLLLVSPSVQFSSFRGAVPVRLGRLLFHALLCSSVLCFLGLSISCPVGMLPVPRQHSMKCIGRLVFRKDASDRSHSSHLISSPLMHTTDPPRSKQCLPSCHSFIHSFIPFITSLRFTSLIFSAMLCMCT